MDITKMNGVESTASSIKPINVDTVHKICSGQVVLSLAVAVKELVENSLDANATVIDIRFKNYGIDLIEVTDNGSGVTDDNFAGLTMKHHTSKLTEYSDLLGVSSFGFRGEALSSLCALAKMSIITRHSSSKYASHIEYDYRGNITKKKPCSRQVGTTITLSNLFHSLPVRQKEFHKNAKREFNKMTQLLYAYCLISLGVKITCSNQTNANNKTTVLATQGSKSYKDIIACIFGMKQLNNLLEIKPEYEPTIKDNIFKGLSQDVVNSQDSPNIEEVLIDLSEDSNEADSIQDSQKSSQGHINKANPVQFTGFISSCAHGCGRSSADRQFFYVNSRPCEPTKVIKLINEIYRQYNSNQYPFIFLNVNLERTTVDVNVTPDKRKIFLTREKIVLDVLKCSIVKLFESIPRTLKVEKFDIINSSDVKANLDQPRIFNSFLQNFASKSESKKSSKPVVAKNSKELKRKSTTMLDFVSSKSKQPNMTQKDDVAEIYEIGEDDSSSEDNDTIDTTNIKDDKATHNEEAKDVVYLEFSDHLPTTQIRKLSDVITVKSYTNNCRNKNAVVRPSSSPKLKDVPVLSNNVVTDTEDLGQQKRRSVTVKTSLEHVKQLTSMYNKQTKSKAPERVKFKTAINPVFNKKCEEELTKEINKGSFKLMQVIGQFNLGFIITRLDDDLFIIDQHATDEIYNFETLQKTTELSNQKLVIPQQLELSGVNEQILVDNLEVFKKNGFTFEINENELPTKRVKLLTIPMSKNWIFGKEDIEELLFMLRENSSEYCRPSRVRAMFASRACRKSVMIGTALSKSDMKKLVDHMAEIDKPWNCPHGRPTVRHLVNLAMVHTQNE